MNLRDALPWQLKMASKVVLSRLPLPYSAWRRLAVCRHGEMDNPEYALGELLAHLRTAGIAPGRSSGAMLELGPGDALTSGLAGAALGFSPIYLVDVGSFARSDLAPYRAMAAFLQEQGYAPPEIGLARSLEEILGMCRARYLTAGLESLRSLPDASIDFVWSSAVLEHIRRAEFLPVMRELRRILKESGVGSHSVDFRDHLGGALNNLRFSSATWESPRLAGSGFYTNRIRFEEMQALFRQAGFYVEADHVCRWALLPTPRRSLDPEFRHLREEDLVVSSADFLLRPAERPDPRG